MSSLKNIASTLFAATVLTVPLFAQALSGCPTGTGTTYTWTGGANTSNWDAPANWDMGVAPSLASDNIIVNPTNGPQPKLNNSTTVANFCMSGGTIDLNNHTLTVSGSAFFDGGHVTSSSGVQTAQLNISGGGSAQNVTYAGTQFSVPVVANCPYIYLNGSVFNESVDLTLSAGGSLNVHSDGGNIYHKSVTLTNSSGHAWSFSHAAISDQFFGELEVTNYIGSIYLVDKGGGNYFDDNVTLTAEGGSIRVGHNGATNVTFNGNLLTLKAQGGSVSVGATGTGDDFVINSDIVASGSSSVAIGSTTNSVKVSSGHTLAATQSWGSFVLNATNTHFEEQVGQHQITLSGNARLDIISCTFDGPVNVTVPQVKITGSHFNGSTRIEQNGSGTLANGGNIFNSDLQLLQTGSGTLRMGLEAGDIYNGNVDVTRSAGTVELAYAYNNHFNKNITINTSTNVKLGSPFTQDNSTVVLSGIDDQTIQCTGCSGSDFIQLHKLVVDKPSGRVYIESNIQITTVASFVKGIVYTSPGSLLKITISGIWPLIDEYGPESYVNGPIAVEDKEGIRELGDIVVFPTGKAGRFMPIAMEMLHIGQDIYTAEFFTGDVETPSGASLGSPFETYDDCSYWTLEHTGPSNNAEPEIYLSWGASSCNITQDYSYLQVACYDNALSSWKSLGHGEFGALPNVPDFSSSSTFPNKWFLRSDVANNPINDQFHYFAIASVKKEEDELPYGYSYNNFGVYTRINGGAHLHVRGNVYNDRAIDGTGQPINSQPGWFENLGTIHLTRDWINYSNNAAFRGSADGAYEGKVEMFGDYQRILGKDQELDVTQFHDLEINGNGKKELFIDAWVNGQLNLNDAELAARRNKLVVNVLYGSAITSDAGFVSTDEEGGTLRRYVVEGGGNYKFPMGSREGVPRLRPVVISNQPLPTAGQGDPNPNSGSNINPNIEVFDVVFHNHSAELDGYNLQDKLPHIIEVSDKFYYELAHVSTNPVTCAVNVPPNSPSSGCNTGGVSPMSHPMDWHFFYDNVADGTVNAVVHYDDNVSPNYFTGYGNPYIDSMALVGPYFPPSGQGDAIWKTPDNTTPYQNFGTSLPNDFLEVKDYYDFSGNVFTIAESGLIVSTVFGSGNDGTYTVVGNGSTYGTGSGSGSQIIPPGNGGSITLGFNGGNSSSGGDIEIPINGGAVGDGITITLDNGANGNLDTTLFNGEGPTLGFIGTPTDTGVAACTARYMFEGSDALVFSGDLKVLKSESQTSSNFVAVTAGDLNQTEALVLTDKDNIVYTYDAGTVANGINISTSSFTTGPYKFTLTDVSGNVFSGQIIIQNQ